MVQRSPSGNVMGFSSWDFVDGHEAHDTSLAYPLSIFKDEMMGQ